MATETINAAGRRATNGIYFKVTGDGEPLLLLHGLMANGDMFDPLLPLLQDRFRMLIPDLRGHGNSGDLPGPYDVEALTADLDTVMQETGFETCTVLGYSHGGAVAQQLARTMPARVSRLILGCTYACNVSTFRERMETRLIGALLSLFSPKTLANLIVRPSKPKRTGAIGLTNEQAEWLRGILGSNHAPAMREAVAGLMTFDSRPWLKELKLPTLVIGGADDTAVPRHHFDELVGGIPGATGRLVERAEHTLIWTHTSELAEMVRSAFARKQPQ
jgi:pimeloyl-ACP methyl ester carboxylesterase